MKTLTSKPLDVDGLQVEVVWDEFITGSSFFIPCVNERSLATTVLMQARKFGMRLKFKARIENGMWGIRFWRVA